MGGSRAGSCTGPGSQVIPVLKYLHLLFPLTVQSIQPFVLSLSHSRSSARSSVLYGRRRAPSSSPRSVAGSRPAGAVSSLPAACSSLASAVHPSFPPAVRVVGRGQPGFAAQKRGACQPPVADLRQRWSAHVLRHVDPVPSIVLSRCLTGSWAARCRLLLLGWRVLFPPLGVDLCHDLGSAALRVPRPYKRRGVHGELEGALTDGEDGGESLNFGDGRESRPAGSVQRGLGAPAVQRSRE
jgi:hypothetical protein